MWQPCDLYLPSPRSQADRGALGPAGALESLTYPGWRERWEGQRLGVERVSLAPGSQGEGLVIYTGSMGLSVERVVSCPFL